MQPPENYQQISTANLPPESSTRFRMVHKQWIKLNGLETAGKGEKIFWFMYMLRTVEPSGFNSYNYFSKFKYSLV